MRLVNQSVPPILSKLRNIGALPMAYAKELLIAGGFGQRIF